MWTVLSMLVHLPLSFQGRERGASHADERYIDYGAVTSANSAQMPESPRIIRWLGSDTVESILGCLDSQRPDEL